MEEHGWPVSVLWTQERTFPFYQNSGWEAMGSQDSGGPAALLAVLPRRRFMGSCEENEPLRPRAR